MKDSLRRAAGYYFNALATIGMAAIAGACLITEHPEVAGDAILRGLLALFFAMMSFLSLQATLGSWLRMHGVSKIGVEMGFVTDE